jgi:putative transposase
MPWGLKRYYGDGGLHFITWSCHHRQPLLATPARRDLFLTGLEQMRERYRFAVIGYVVMPEHVHLLISEPQIANPSTAVQAVKLGFSQNSSVEFAPASPVTFGSAAFTISICGVRAKRSKN